MVDAIMAIDIKKAINGLITAPLVVLVYLFLAGVSAPGWIASTFGLMSVEAHAEDQRKLEARDKQHKDEVERQIAGLTKSVDEIQTAQTAHITEFTFFNAAQMERAYQQDLNEHLKENLGTAAWQATKERLEQKLALAKQYKQCVLNGQANCHLIQKQLWQ